MNKKKKAFTLIELLAVIVILAMIALIATPIILNILDESRNKANVNSAYGLVDATKLYYSQNALEGNVSYNTNILDIIKVAGKKPDSGYVYVNKDGQILIGAMYDNKCLIKGYDESKITESEDISVCEVPPVLTGPDGANIPVLDNGLVGITIADNGDIARADTSTTNWYNYDEKKWANAVVLNDKNGEVVKENVLAYYVWIPKYEYKNDLTPGKGNEKSIDIKFIAKDKTTASDNYIIPPGFTFGEQNLSGIWVAKFETSYTDTNIDGSKFECTSEDCEYADNIRILPGIYSFRGTKLSESFYISRGLERVYNLTGNSHMMKNSEWAAVSYLSHSKYGKNGEVDIAKKYTTGGDEGNAYVSNVGQSTTGNITGIYDMSGGANEYMMSFNANSSSKPAISYTGFKKLPESKYYDMLLDSNTNEGHAIKDTAGWYDDRSGTSSGYSLWIMRGGTYGNGLESGLWHYSYYSGDDVNSFSFRPVFTPAE